MKMTNKKYDSLDLDLECEIIEYLEDVKTYINDTIFYLKNDNCDLDKYELIMYLSSVNETINDVNRILKKYMPYERKCNHYGKL